MVDTSTKLNVLGCHVNLKSMGWYTTVPQKLSPESRAPKTGVCDRRPHPALTSTSLLQPFENIPRR
jgi:hypothetical protein